MLDPKSDRYESGIAGKIGKMAANYVEAGLQALNYFIPEMDAANDVAELYAPISEKNFTSRQRNDPKNFSHPMGATELWTLATFISQILFGGEVTRSVEGREDNDEDAANSINELLAWNDTQFPSYNIGFLWIKDAIVFNRGVMYDCWKAKIAFEPEEVEEDDWTKEPTSVMKKDGSGSRKKSNGEPYLEYPKRTRIRKKRKVVGGYNNVDLVSPYDFISDPEFPGLRFQDGRFAGHRVLMSWLELERRSNLDVTDSEYVFPSVVAKLKNRKKDSTLSSIGGASKDSNSRSFHERKRRGKSETAGLAADTSKDDGGVVECWVNYIKCSPASIELFEDDHEVEIIEFLMAGSDTLSVNIIPNTHNQFPYAVGEARPNGHYQFATSWAMVIKPIQDYVDYLRRRHATNIARSGNIYIGDPSKVNFEDFLDPDKDGLFIAINENGAGQPLNTIIQQVPITDSTAGFPAEMQMWVKDAENAIGAHGFVQGQTEDSSQTATQFVGVQQMAAGRISSIARLLATPALTQQTLRFVCNFQDFMPEQQTIRIQSQTDDFDPDVPVQTFKTINKSDIQSQFDVVPHDGSLPGTDAKKVAALTRVIESWASGNPVFQGIFDPTIPGSLDPKKIFYKLMRMSGFPIKGIAVSREQAQKNLMANSQAQGAGTGQPEPQLPPQPAAAPGAPPSGAPLDDSTGMPSASQLPPIPSAAPPEVSPAQV